MSGVGDEKRGKHVDRIVDVTDEDDDAEHNRYCDAEIPDKWVLPEYERHEEGESGVTRKEEVTGKYEIPEEFGRWCDNLRGKRADVGQADRDGPNEYEEWDTLEYERRFSGVGEAEDDYIEHEEKCPISENNIDVIGGCIAENYIRDGIACCVACIFSGIEIEYQGAR